MQICTVLLHLLNHKFWLKVAAVTLKSLYAAGCPFFEVMLWQVVPTNMRLQRSTWPRSLFPHLKEDVGPRTSQPLG